MAGLEIYQTRFANLRRGLATEVDQGLGLIDVSLQRVKVSVVRHADVFDCRSS